MRDQKTQQSFGNWLQSKAPYATIRRFRIKFVSVHKLNFFDKSETLTLLLPRALQKIVR